MSKKNIYFYSLKVIQTVLLNETPLKEALKKDEVYEFMNNLHASLPTNADGFKFLKHDIVDDQYYLIEFMDFDEESTFVRLGKPSQNNEVGKRSTKSYNLVDIPLADAELIEAYTYLYLDFKTDVISFVRGNSAPSVKWFATPLTAYDSGSGRSVICTPFTTDEILNSFGSKADIGSISITTVKPTPEVAEHLNGLTKKDIDDLASDEMNVVFTIKPKRRGGNTLNNTSMLANLFNKTKEKETRMSKFVVNIADETDEKKAGIDLLNYKFTRSSDIFSTSKLTTEQYKNEIVKVYKKEIATIKKLFII